MNDIKSYLLESQSILKSFIENDYNIHKIQQSIDLMVNGLKNGNKLISCGNGGSMSDAMHFAEELSGRYRENRPALAAVSISDPTHITCVGNDYGFNKIFSRYIEANGKSGDVLLAISTSGNSENVIEAVKIARLMDMKVIGLTGKSGGYLAELCDIEIRVDWNGYADHIQEIHIKVIHAMIMGIEKGMF